MSDRAWAEACRRGTIGPMRPLASTVLALLAAAALAPGSARAEAPAPATTPPPPPPPPYRRMMMFGDLGAALFVGGGAALTWSNRDCACEDFSGGLIVIGAGIYVAWGATVHHGAGHDGRAVASVVVRASLPIGAGLLADRLGAGTTRALLAAGGGAVAGMALDWALARRDRPPRSPSAPVAIYAAPTATGAIAGLAGRW